MGWPVGDRPLPQKCCSVASSAHSVCSAAEDSAGHSGRYSTGVAHQISSNTANAVRTVLAYYDSRSLGQFKEWRFSNRHTALTKRRSSGAPPPPAGACMAPNSGANSSGSAAAAEPCLLLVLFQLRFYRALDFLVEFLVRLERVLGCIPALSQLRSAIVQPRAAFLNDLLLQSQV
jgi:hypothetical protein